MVNKSILFLCFISCLAGQSLPPSTNQFIGDFSLITYYPGYYFTPIISNKFSFPEYPLVPPQTGFPAFLVLTNTNPIKMSGLLRVSYTVNTTPNAVFRFGGQDKWNFGTTPPHARLFFSTKIGYNNNDPCHECYWFSQDGWHELTNGNYSIEALLDYSRWTDGQGQQSSSNFNNALTNVIQLGLSFGGGSFYDIGCAMTTGDADLQVTYLKDFPLLNLQISTDLSNWSSLGGISLIPTNGQIFIRLHED